MTLAVADAIGQLTIDTAKYKDAVLLGTQLSTQADFNQFIVQATDAELQAVAEKLGIENWDNITNEVFRDKIAQFAANGGVESYREQNSLVQEAKAVAPETAKKSLPRMVNLREDGTYRYTQNGTDIALTKRGETYYVYDYDSNRMSKPLSRTETNKVLREIHTNATAYTDNVKKHNEAVKKRKQEVEKIDSFLRENIKNYKNLSATGKAAVQSIIRQGRALGIPEDYVLTCARVSARSGLSIFFSKEASFVMENGDYADGAIDLKNNRIIINPEAKKRSGEMILIHELTHAIYNTKKGVLKLAKGIKSMSAEERNKVSSGYKKIGANETVIKDELNAHHAEKTLSNKNILKRLVETTPTLKDKILSFFKKAKVDYAEDEKLSYAADRLYRQYKKLFDKFSDSNQRNLGLENATVQATNEAADTSVTAKSATNGVRYSIQTINGEQMVVIDTDQNIFEGVDIKDYPKTVRNYMLSKFSNKVFPIGTSSTYVNARSVKEYTFPANRRQDSEVKAKKMQAGTELDNLLKVADYIGHEVDDGRHPEAVRGWDKYKTRFTFDGENIFEGEISIKLTERGDAFYDITKIKNTSAARTAGTVQDSSSVSDKGVSTSSISNNSEVVNNKSKKNSKNNKNYRYALSETLKHLKNYTDTEIASIESAKMFQVARSYEDVQAFIANARSMKTEQRLFLGKVSNETATKIREATGLNVDGKSIVLSSSDIKHIFKNHGLNGAELLRGQVPVTEVNFEDIIDVLIKPETVSRSDENGQIGLKFQKEINGKITAITIVSEKKKALTLKSAWIIKKKQSTSPTPNVQALSLTSETGGRIKTVSTSSISENSENVNTKTEKNKDIRYSLRETDSNGLELTAQQREYFKDSKVVDSDGRLLEVYHNTENEFTVFDKEFIGSGISGGTNNLGEGFYFTDDDSYSFLAHQKAVYLNITKPYYLGGRDSSNQWKSLIENSTRQYDKDINWTAPHSTFTAISMVYKVGGERAKELFTTLLKEQGYDGIIEVGWGSNDYVVFDSNQIKLTSNKNPTANQDIRYALPIDRYTEKQYNDFGWVRANEVLGVRQWQDFNSKYSQAKNGTFFNKTASGEFIIPVNDGDGVNNALVYVRGSIESPKVSRIIKIDQYTETELTETRRDIYAFERRGVQPEIGELLRLYTPLDVKFNDYQGNRDKNARHNNGQRADGRAGSGKAKTIKSVYSQKDGRQVVTYWDGSGDTRYALPEDNKSYGGFSVGQRAKFAANHTGMRVYTRTEANEVISSILEERLTFDKEGLQGELRGKNRQEIVDYLFIRLNRVQEGYRMEVALKVADFILEHTVLTDMSVDASTAEAMRTLAVLRSYMHKLDIGNIQGKVGKGIVQKWGAGHSVKFLPLARRIVYYNITKNSILVYYGKIKR